MSTHTAVLSNEDDDDLNIDHVGWIVRLRWLALSGITGGIVGVLLGLNPGVNWKVLVPTIFCAAVYNTWLSVSRENTKSQDSSEAVHQAIFDMVLLTIVLWTSGGINSPFIAYYLFHVAIAGILGGNRATVIASLTAVLGFGFLAVGEYIPALQIGSWTPIPPWDVFTEVLAFGTAVGAIAYLATHSARRLTRRERALSRARDRANLELQILNNTVNQIGAGLEVVENGGAVLWRNKRAEHLAQQAQGTNSASAIQVAATTEGSQHRGEESRRFPAKVGNIERVFEQHVFPLNQGPDGSLRAMNLYVDCTEGMIAEQKLVFAERLASLGRITQGVAHELNTPLATVRTLSKDMLCAMDEEPDSSSSALLNDLRESATLIHDETRRLGKITQGLLTGRDLTASEIVGAVPLGAVVERAHALVFAGFRKSVPIDVSLSTDLADYQVVADPDHLVQVLVNLLQNAYDAATEVPGASVSVYADRSDEHVEIRVEDTGPGVSEDMQGRLFEPFATTKPPGKGTGLGLYTSFMLIKSMNGELELLPRLPCGTSVRIKLPAAQSNAS